MSGKSLIPLLTVLFPSKWGIGHTHTCLCDAQIWGVIQGWYLGDFYLKVELKGLNFSGSADRRVELPMSRGGVGAPPQPIGEPSGPPANGGCIGQGFALTIPPPDLIM